MRQAGLFGVGIVGVHDEVMQVVELLQPLTEASEPGGLAVSAKVALETGYLQILQLR